MILTCPSCGATHSAEAWENDVKARQTMAACTALPPEIGPAVLGYLALFRPEQRALSWSKSLRLLQELGRLINTGYVQIQGKVARPAPPAIWAAGMLEMAERSATLSRPLKNHNYLRQVVHQLADQADAGRERRLRQAEQSGATRARRAPAATPTPDDGLTQLERQYLEKHGHLPGDDGSIRSGADLARWAREKFGTDDTKQGEQA